MIEYIRHIHEYSNYAHSSFSKLVPADKWGNKQIAEEYLEKYWLKENEYLNVWKQIQDKVFVQGNSFPDLIYNPEFEIMALKGGCLFLEEDFNQLKNIMLELGEEYFVIIQHSQEFTSEEPMFRMKFPVNITWDELTSGNYISAVLFEMSYNEYFVYGESATWGKYSANDYDYPLDIIGFKSELRFIFQNQFIQSLEEQKEIKDWLPYEYKRIVK